MGLSVKVLKEFLNTNAYPPRSTLQQLQGYGAALPGPPGQNRYLVGNPHEEPIFISAKLLISLLTRPPFTC